MGNKSSVATMGVVFDNPIVIAGSTVTGKVYLSVNQDEVSCNAIGCRLFGQEATRVRYTVHVGSGDKRRTERRIARERRNFIDLRFRLLTVTDKKLRRGQYEYPFQFTIPSGAPASMYAQALGASGNCKISYTMEVWLDRPGLLRWDVKHRVYVYVENPPPLNKNHTPLYIEPIRVPLHSFCCIPRGEILMGGSADSSVLSAGGQASIKYAVQNNSGVPIKAIEINIQERITFHARGHHGHCFGNLYHVRLSPGEAGLELAMRAAQSANPDEDLRALSAMLQSDLYKLDFTLPGTARNTYSGSIIRVQHVFQIQAITTMGTANPVITRNITVHSRGVRPEIAQEVVDGDDDDEEDKAEKEASAPSPQLPAGWAPTVATRVELPPLALVFPVEHAEDGDSTQVAYVNSASTYPAVEVYRSFDQFLAALQQPYDSCGKLERFIRNGNSIDALTADQYYAMFRTMEDPFDQQRFADILAGAATMVSCTKVARGVAGCKDLCKREVAEKLLAAGRIVDKGNAQLVRAELTPFQYMTVEKYFA